MRLLIVDVNFEYKNPTYRQFYTSLLHCMEVDFFGPGYVSRECLEKGIDAYLFANGEYDAVILGTYFVYSSGEKRTRYDAYGVHRYTIPYYNVNDAYQCCGEIFKELKRLKDIIKIFLYYEDFPSLPAIDRDICQDLIEHNFYVMSWPIEYMEICSRNLMHNYIGFNNYAYKFAEKNQSCYIPVSLHGIGYHEIFIRNFLERNYEWCIPGNRISVYPERTKAHKLLEKESEKVWNEDPFQELSVFSIKREHMEWYKFRNKSEMFLSWIWKKNNFISSYPKMSYIAACREQYMESMRQSKFVYAEGGIANCFVRKYFEACACGAVLVGKKVSGMSEFGFVHEKNCIIVENYEEISGIDKKYSSRQFEEIAKAGQSLIVEKHMFVHRAEALRATIKAIAQGSYNGAFWEDGNYVIKEKQSKKITDKTDRNLGEL